MHISEIVGVHDESHTGQPSTSRTNMNLTQVQKLIFNYRGVTNWGLSVILKYWLELYQHCPWL